MSMGMLCEPTDGRTRLLHVKISVDVVGLYFCGLFCASGGGLTRLLRVRVLVEGVSKYFLCTLGL